MSEFQPTYTVVINHEEQYSIWLVGKELPIGWREGKSFQLVGARLENRVANKNV